MKRVIMIMSAWLLEPLEGSKPPRSNGRLPGSESVPEQTGTQVEGERAAAVAGVTTVYIYMPHAACNAATEALDLPPPLQPPAWLATPQLVHSARQTRKSGLVMGAHVMAADMYRSPLYMYCSISVLHQGPDSPAIGCMYFCKYTAAVCRGCSAVELEVDCKEAAYMPCSEGSVSLVCTESAGTSTGQSHHTVVRMLPGPDIQASQCLAKVDGEWAAAVAGVPTVCAA